MEYKVSVKITVVKLASKNTTSDTWQPVNGRMVERSNPLDLSATENVDVECFTWL